MVKRQSPFLWLSVAFVAFVAGVLAAAWSVSHDSTLPAEALAALNGFAWAVAAAAAALGVVVWKVVEYCVVRPAKSLAVELRAIGHGDGRTSIDVARYAGLPVLPEVIADLVAKLGVARAHVNDAVAIATASAETEKARLAAILNDLHEGVVVCNMKHQVVLYNQIALGLLHVAGQMGLGRSLFGLVSKEPVLHILDVLLHRPRNSLDSAPFITGSTDGRSLLQGRMSLVRAQDEITGYVITFNDVTDSVAALAKRDALLREVIDGLRDPVERLNSPEHDPAIASQDIAAALERVTKGYRSLVAGWWPMSDLYSADLFDFVIRRLENSGLKVTMTGLPIWLHGDSHSLVLALDALVRAIAKGAGADELDLAAEAEGRHGWICIVWRGARVDDDSLIGWQKTTISQALGGMTVRDVMLHHTREDLVEEAVDGVVTLRIALSLGREGQDRIAEAEQLPPRPEFFDFNLLAQAQAGDMGAVRLRDLTYVVFDTETTGLRPSQGDQIVSIAGVRIVNPGRPIPPESIVFHGITDEMVIDKPPLSVVLPQFKAYSADSVLVAHNAAFDMKFIRMRENDCGLCFDNTVLDTMLLSSYVDGTPEGQSLDAIADRYGITVTDRHTALGDSLVTAAVLLRLIDALEAKGIVTLDDAMTTLNMTMELHNRAQAFG